MQTEAGFGQTFWFIPLSAPTIRVHLEYSVHRANGSSWRYSLFPCRILESVVSQRTDLRWDLGFKCSSRPRRNFKSGEKRNLTLMTTDHKFVNCCSRTWNYVRDDALIFICTSLSSAACVLSYLIAADATISYLRAK